MKKIANSTRTQRTFQRTTYGSGDTGFLVSAQALNEITAPHLQRQKKRHVISQRAGHNAAR
jgi:hypothetical protein